MDLGAVAGITTAVSVGVVAFLALTIAGVVILRRRARDGATATARVRSGRASDLSLEAGSALVRADDAIRDSRAELDYAIAQFGEEGTAEFADAIETSSRELDRAFRLRERASSTDPRVARERDREVRALAIRAGDRVERLARDFDRLRRSEADAPARLTQLRADVARVASQRTEAEGLLDALRDSYSTAALGGLAARLPEADASLADASSALDRAEEELGARATPAVTTTLADADSLVRRARRSLDAVARRRDELADADSELDRLRSTERASVADARRVRDDPPDPDAAAAVNDAIAVLEPLLTPSSGALRDPVSELGRLVAAADRLDVAVAAAHNEQRRLDGARAALDGAIVAARSEISRASDAVGGLRGGGESARSRLSEARRELELALVESDPVAALDGARRATTHARDADALARYRGA